jgi:hypothetical protein
MAAALRSVRGLLVMAAGPALVVALTLGAWLGLELPPAGPPRLWVAAAVATALGIVEVFLWVDFLFNVGLDGDRRSRRAFVVRHALLGGLAIVAVVYVPFTVLLTWVLHRPGRAERA